MAAVPAQGATPSNTYLETAAIGVKEDLADIIYQIDPDETPLVSAISRVNAQQVLTEWLVQTLNAAGDNAQPEGFTATDEQTASAIQLRPWI